MLFKSFIYTLKIIDKNSNYRNNITDIIVANNRRDIMSKILVFSASTGGGHNSAAKSLKKKFEEYNHEVKIVDILTLRNKIIESFISDGYEILSCSLPIVYRELYNYSNREIVNKRMSVAISKMFTKKIKNLILDEDADLIIGTHAFIVKPMEKLKKKGKITVPYISVVTDFKAHITYLSKYVDAYITGSEFTKQDLIKKGISSEKIFAYGIPVRQEFLNKSYHHKEVFNILVMGGSMGAKGIEPLLDQIINCKNKYKISIVCANNKSLYRNITENYEELFKEKGYDIDVYGFTDKISELMDKADLLISKPGGLTASEALVKELPMLIPFMIPGQEEENAEFLNSAGAALLCRDNIDIAVDRIINDSAIIKNMKSSIRDITKRYSIDNIVLLSERLINDESKLNN